mgnify:CR=1 FL=1
MNLPFNRDGTRDNKFGRDRDVNSPFNKHGTRKRGAGIPMFMVVSPLCDCIGLKLTCKFNLILIRIINIIIRIKSSVNSKESSVVLWMLDGSKRVRLYLQSWERSALG